MARHVWTSCVSLLLLTILRVRAVTQPEFPAFETASRIVLSSSRGYRDVLIAIGENVPENETLIEGIMKVFEEFSSFLYSATNVYGSGLFFEEVRILIPNSWSDNPRYEPRTWESFGASDVRVDHPPSNALSNRNQPSTNKPTHCGAPGLYIHLTPEYITDDAVARPYGDRSRALTHEWGHYRWGVFDEYPLPGDDHFYATADGSYQATRCVEAITGAERRSDLSPCTYDPVSGRPDDECRFIDDDDQSERYQASLMYKQFLPEMRTFCDSSDVTGFQLATTHNALAPNQQNIQCAARSIWEVMREHSDFPSTPPTPQGGKLPDIGALPQINVVPNFRLIKQQGTREPIVLVLDTSGSMSGHQRLHVLRQASFNLITRVLDDNQLFALVTFNKTAYTIIPLAEAGQDRTRLTNLLPDLAGGGTSIASGILEGINVISSAPDSYSDVQMVVLTDGEERNPPHIEDVMTSQLSGVRVHTIAIGPDATPSLEGVANRTDGETFEHSDQSAALFNIFTQLAIQDDSGIITILSEAFVTGNITRRFSPGSLSDDTMTILVGFPSGFINDSIVIVTKPDGTVIRNDTRLAAPDTFRTIHAFGLVQIDTDVMPGVWELRVEYYGAYNFFNLTGTMHVETARRRSATTAGNAPSAGFGGPSVVLPIEIDAEWGLPSVNPCQIQTVQVTVSEGYTPVADAKVEVTVSRPNTVDSVNVNVYDDGVGADVRKDDGVYSAFFTDFKGEGRYNMEVAVTGVEGVTKVMNGYRVGEGPAAANPDFLQEEQAETEFTGQFNRFIVGNSFTCIGEELCSGDQDLYSPYRITDLRGSLGENRTAVLTFTATGDDLDQGTATYYELRIAKNITEMLARFNDTEILKFIPEALRTNETQPPYVISGNLSSPLPSRNTEVFRVQLPETVGEFSYIFSVVAVDDGGRRSQPSNFASVTGNIVNAPISAGLVVLLVVIILLLCAIIILALYFIRKMRQPKKKDDAEMMNGSQANLTKNEVTPGALIQTANLRNGVDQNLDKNSNSHDPGENYRFVMGNSSAGTGDRMESAYHFTDAPVSSNYAASRATKVYTESSETFQGMRNPVFDGNAGHSPSPGHPPPRPPSKDLSKVNEDDDSFDYERVPDPNTSNSHDMGMMKPGIPGPILPQKMNAGGGDAPRVALRPAPTPRHSKQPLISGDSTASDHDYDEPPPSSLTRNARHRDDDDDDDSDKNDYEPVIDPNTGIPFGLA